MIGGRLSALSGFCNRWCLERAAELHVESACRAYIKPFTLFIVEKELDAETQMKTPVIGAPDQAGAEFSHDSPLLHVADPFVEIMEVSAEE